MPALGFAPLGRLRLEVLEFLRVHGHVSAEVLLRAAASFELLGVRRLLLEVVQHPVWAEALSALALGPRAPVILTRVAAEVLKVTHAVRGRDAMTGGERWGTLVVQQGLWW